MSHDHDFIFFIREFVAGCIGGWTTTIVGQPFDIIKVRLQNQIHDSPIYKGALDCAYKLVKNEGFKAFYKGTLAPFIGCGLCLSVQFGVDGSMKKFFKYFTNHHGHLAFPYLYLSGCLGGGSQGLILIPTEHIRIRMQLQTGIGMDRQYTSTIDCFNQIVKKYGLKGLFKGGVATMWRELPPGGIYFTTYEYSCRYFTPHGKRRKDVSSLAIAFSGSLAGYAYWISCYPFDIIKTKMQGDDFINPKYLNFRDCFKKTLQHGGFRGLFDGIGTCLLRAGPANAAGFSGFEYAMYYMTHNDPHY